MELIAERGISLVHMTVMRWKHTMFRNSKSAGTASHVEPVPLGASTTPT